MITKKNYPIDPFQFFRYNVDLDEWSIVLHETLAPELSRETLFVLNEQLYVGGELWRKYDLGTMSNLGYFPATPDTTSCCHIRSASAGFVIKNKGYILYSNREFWQYVP
jgi:hypothetical protein